MHPLRASALLKENIKKRGKAFRVLLFNVFTVISQIEKRVILRFPFSPYLIRVGLPPPSPIILRNAESSDARRSRHSPSTMSVLPPARKATGRRWMMICREKPRRPRATQELCPNTLQGQPQSRYHMMSDSRFCLRRRKLVAHPRQYRTQLFVGKLDGLEHGDYLPFSVRKYNIGILAHHLGDNVLFGRNRSSSYESNDICIHLSNPS